MRALPDRHLRRMGPERRGPCLRPDVRRHARGVFRQLQTVHPRPHLRIWTGTSSTTATSIPATTTSSRATAWATSPRRTCSTWSRRRISASSASTSRRRSPKQCLECDVRFLCNGGCPKDRFASLSRRRTRSQLSLLRAQGVLRSRQPGDADDGSLDQEQPRAGRNHGDVRGERTRQGSDGFCHCGSGRCSRGVTAPSQEPCA